MPHPSIQLGEYLIRPVSDGDLTTNVEFVLGIDRPVAQGLAGTDDSGKIIIPVTSFLISGAGDSLVLVDAGSGTQMQPTLGRLPANLRALGVDPATITHVVLTHIHPDHANGLIDDDGAANFPNAALVVAAEEANFWMAPAAAAESPALARQRARNALNLAPYLDRLHIVKNGESLLGLTAMVTPGHTPGHTCWRLDAANQSLLAWGDIVHIAAIQIPRPDAGVFYDMDLDAARASRARILDMAARDRLLIAGAHVTAPGVGHVVRHGEGYVYEPQI